MEITPKTAILRHCISCDFKCSKNIDWERHISTAKHQNRTNLNNLEQITPFYAKPLFVCKNCNKTYNARNSLWYHEKKCNTNTNECGILQLQIDLSRENTGEKIKIHGIFPNEGVEVSSDDDEEETRTKVRKKSSGDDELENYSESVQRRINQLTAKRKQASEEAQAAVQYAQTIQQENAQMKQRLQQMSAGYNTEAEGRLNAQEAQATRAYAEASEAGDYDRAAKAQQALAQIAVAKDKVQARKANVDRQRAQEQHQQTAQVQQQQEELPL